jgi:hypothetical protein
MSMYLSEEDQLSFEAARQQAKALQEQGKYEEARQVACDASRIVNQSSMQALQSKNLYPDEDLPFLDIPEQPTKELTIILSIHLIVGSELYNDILKVLEKHQEEKK